MFFKVSTFYNVDYKDIDDSVTFIEIKKFITELFKIVE